MSEPRDSKNTFAHEKSSKTPRTSAGSEHRRSIDPAKGNREFMDTVQIWMKQHDEELEKASGMLSDTNTRVEKLEKRVKEGLDNCEARATTQPRSNRASAIMAHQVSSHSMRLGELEKQVEENHDWTKNSISEIQEYYNAGAAANNGNDL
ncbi:hypothetical protein N7481_004709 [Penicillium waksmanii]|uniref:uncharacterized protein n=1 Tax=Penicillium waksmanii TaxID=69791 RepID=UPI0025466377|nr:uncharacterized protein N7481_004709 [Penicillium waksmanii]KAJ5989499.1 hypothetical protein N7481_004709 [Penicillium waksmanii]